MSDERANAGTPKTGIPDPRRALPVYLEQAHAGQSRAATQTTLSLLDSGAPMDCVVTELLAAAQCEVGERWLANDWSVAEEHLATGVTTASMQALGNAIPSRDDRGLVVVACAEGDWHSLPALMITELLRAEDWMVAFLGASTPAEHVETFLSRTPPVALAVSCSIPLYFLGVARLADAAHRQGVPVLAGGRALGDSDTRARRLGADAWAPTARAASSLLAGWQQCDDVAVAPPTELDASAVALELRSEEIAAGAYRQLLGTYPAMADYDSRSLERTREDLAYIVRYVAASLLVADATVFAEFLAWLERLLNARKVPTAALVAGLDALGPALEAADPRTGALLTSGTALLRSHV